jgi:hypothetical protein
VAAGAVLACGHPVYECSYCGRVAPAFDDPAILQWEGGEAVYLSADVDLPQGSLVCPDCRPEEHDREEGPGD